MAKDENHLPSSTWLPRQKLDIRRRFLPHWRMEGAIYFVTFSLRDGQLSVEEILLVKQHIIDSARGNCRLHALCVMPDHVHLIIEPFQDITLARIMQKFKGGSALKINRMRGKQGPLWQIESWDRIIRDDEEYLEKMNYILQNPVKAELTESFWSWCGSYLDLMPG